MQRLAYQTGRELPEKAQTFAAQYLACEKALNLDRTSTMPVIDELLCESWIPRAAFHDLSREHIA